MHILLITDAYPPEVRSASHLMLELAEELITRGHKVSVVTCWPEYNLVNNVAKEAFRERQTESGVEVIRIKTMRHHKVNYVMRGIAQFVLPFLFLRKIKKYQLINAGAVVVYSPPLPLGLVGRWLKRKGMKFILNLQDIFPQNAIDLGVLKNRWLISLFRSLEKNIYQKAEVITVHSEGNRELLAKHYPNLQAKMKILHNWVDVDYFQQHKTGKDFTDMYNLQGKYVMVFAGVLGPSQNLSFVLRIMEKLKDLTDFFLLIVGDGKNKSQLQAQIQKLGLSNVAIYPFISRDDYPALLKACDLGLVSLSGKNRTPVVPGKILGYMAAGLPVVALLNQESDGHGVIKAANCGYSVVADDLDAAETMLRKCYQQRTDLSHLGQNGYQYAKQHFTKQKCVNDLIELL